MIPPVSTRQLQTAIEKKRRDDAAQRWRMVLSLRRDSFGPARPDIPIARRTRP